MSRRRGVLISGRGSNLQSMVDAIRRGELQAEIAIVISNKPGAAGLLRPFRESGGRPVRRTRGSHARVSACQRLPDPG